MAINRRYYLFAYDIGCPKRQAKVRRLLQGYAAGTQKSLFECYLTPEEYRKLHALISPMLGNGDIVHSFRLPETHNIRLFGTARPLYRDYFIIA